ncbi:MAG: DNA methyltransferase [Paludibacteraceae bacterium]|nr:DNA methyltransferase [Paludibacteraceae bacterium]
MMKTYKRVIDDSWSFRDADTKEYTHGYHSYPAMMIPQVCRTIIDRYHPTGRFELIFDPYVGSGTTPVEAAIANVNSISTDLNPLARMMTKVKTTHYDESTIINQLSSLLESFQNYSEKDVLNVDFKRISNYSFWYSKEVLYKLSFIYQEILRLQSNEDFFSLVLAEVVRETSFTRNGEFKRFRMKQESIDKFKPDVFKIFQQKALRNINGLKEFNKLPYKTTTTICDFNSSVEIPQKIIANESVDMIVTSPPYGDSHTTVAYGQFSRWANEWFGFENAKNLDSLLMGGKKADKELFDTKSIRDVIDKIKLLDIKRYYEVIAFLNDYWESVKNVSKSVRKGGVVCYVVGNRTVKGIQIPLDYFTAEMFEKCGFKHKITIVRSIPNKRMPSKTSPSNIQGQKVSTMTNEYIVILNKV